MADKKDKDEAKEKKKAKPEAEGVSAEAAAEAKAAKAAKAKANKEKGTGKREKAESIRIAAEGETRVSPAKVPRLQTFYKTQVIPSLQKQYGFKNPMQVPRLMKVVINCALKDAVANPKLLDSALLSIMAVTGQKPVMTRAKKAIANFKIRRGLPLAVRVTLRRARMYEFMDRLISIALPRVRDFKGINPKSFDGRGNYSMGLREQIIFPEINYDAVEKIHGFTVTFQTTAKTDEHARSLLQEMGMPFRK
jgi:large subunit ribosomal protein L5